MAILDLKEKIEPFRKNATGYVKQLLSADHVVMSDGTTLQTKMDSLNSALIKIQQFNWTEVNVTAKNPVLLKNFSIDSMWSNRKIIGVVSISFRGYNTEKFIPSIYRQYSLLYFSSTESQSYDIVVNVLYI